MHILLLLLSIAMCVLGVSVQKIFVGTAGDLKKPTLLFCAGWTGIVSLCCGIYVIVTRDFSVAPITIACAVLMGVMAAVNTFTALLAFQKGSLTLSVLIISMCVIIPAFLSIIFLGEALTAPQVIGFVLILIIFVYVNNIGQDIGKKATVSWFLLALVSSISNGLVMFAAKLQQFHLPGQQIPQFFCIGFFAAALTALLMYAVFHRREQASYRYTAQKFLFPALGVALALGGTNFINMFLAAKLPAIVVFPSVQYGSVIATAFVSALFFKENNNLKTYLGVALGAAAIIILNL